MDMNRVSPSQHQSGQVVVLLIISLLTMVLTVSLLFNTGQQVHSKTQTQNAIDSSVISHGSNVARALNVMSVNNVAITQAFTLNILMANLVPELTASTYSALDGLVSYGSGAAKYCPNIYTFFLCAANIAAGIRMAYILKKLVDIWDQIGSFLDPSKVNDAHSMVQALESMNTQLYRNFSNNAATTTTRLGYLNNLDEPPVFIGGGAFYANKEPDLTSPNYNATWLPIEKTTTIAGGSVPFVSGASASAEIQNYGLCVTGYKASPLAYPRLFWNFKEHDYPVGEGPFTIGRDQFNDVIEEQVDNIEQMPEEIPGFTQFDVADFTDFEDLVNVAFPLACVSQTLAKAYSVASPLPGSSFTLYRASKPPLFDIYSKKEIGDWSIFAIARKEQTAGPLGSGLFQNPIKGHYAYAQAEVFNPVWYDLYTQDWTVKMQPASFIGGLHPDFVKIIATFFPEIEPAISEGKVKFNSH